MAYYSSQYYEPPYQSYDHAGDTHDFTSTAEYSSVGYDYYKNYEDSSLFPTPYYYEDSSAWSSSVASYSVFNSSVPKFEEHYNYSPAVTTQFVISYSAASEFNEPEFEEYDPTPYAGGYNIVTTYGQPLPPSAQTCYPKEETKEAPPKQEITKVPLPETAAAVAIDEVQQKQQPPPQQQQPPQEDEEEDEEEEEEEESTDQSSPRQEIYGGYYPWGAGDNGGYEVPLPETQSGYGLDMSGSIFGYNCPCSCHGHRNGESQCANYIFGASPYPYGHGREHGGNYGNPIFGYERHYQEQALQGHVHYEEPSFFNVSTHFL